MKGKGFKNRITVILLAACMAMMLSACGASSKEMATADIAYSSPQELASNSAGFGGGAKYEVTEEAVAMEEAKAEEAGAAAADASTGSVTVSERKLIKTVDMNVETQSFDDLMDTIQVQVEELGGYIESMNTYNGSKYYNYKPIRNAQLTIRIPKEQLDSFLSTVSGIANVVRRSDNVEDVTLAYVDLASHRDALRTEQTRLLELLEKAESVEDIITIEQRLSDVRYQLESMESQLRTYDNQVDYSTVYLNVEEVEIFTPVEEETVWERISSGFLESLDNVGEGFVEFGIWLVVNLPYLVVWAAIIAVFICIVVWLIRRSGRPAKSKAVNSRNLSGSAVNSGTVNGTAEADSPMTGTQGSDGTKKQ